MFASTMKKTFAVLGLAVYSVILCIASLSTDLSVADSPAYTEGLGFGAIVPALSFAVAAIAIALVAVIVKRYCKNDDE